MAADSHPRHVLHHEVARPEFLHQSDEVEYKSISRIIYQPFADERKALARRPAGNEIDIAIPPSMVPMTSAATISSRHELRRIESRNVATKNLCHREVEFVNRGMNGIVFDAGGNIEARLFKAKRKAARTGEQVDGERPPNGKARAPMPA